MYNNWFAGLFMNGILWGPFRFYDVFTMMGWMNWFWDGLALIFIPWWEVIEAIVRSISTNWQWNATETGNYIDKNRLFNWSTNLLVDPYDYKYWSTRPDGIDCNGNRGYGNYCYCPSQGYQCSCRPNSWDTPDQKRDLCFDHYGYDCQGQFVDGESNWC